MKLLFYITFYVSLATVSLATAQKVAVYEQFAPFEKAVVKANDTTYVVNFWATWCAPCVKELPYFEQLHKENKNVKVILVSLDSKKDLEKKLLPFINRKKITAQVVMLSDKDYNSWLDKIDKSWSGSIPATFIFHGKNKQFEEHEFESFAELNDYVNSFINQKK